LYYLRLELLSLEQHKPAQLRVILEMEKLGPSEIFNSAGHAKEEKHAIGNIQN